MKKTLIYIAIFIAIIGGTYIIFRKKPISSLTVYYGQECPHCKNVEQYIQDNKIEEKIKINRKEVYHDEKNAAELGRVANKCGIAGNSVGVPFIYDGSKCYIGEDEAYNLLQQYKS